MGKETSQKCTVMCFARVSLDIFLREIQKKTKHITHKLKGKFQERTQQRRILRYERFWLQDIKISCSYSKDGDNDDNDIRCLIMCCGVSKV